MILISPHGFRHMVDSTYKLAGSHLPDHPDHKSAPIVLNDRNKGPVPFAAHLPGFHIRLGHALLRQPPEGPSESGIPLFYDLDQRALRNHDRALGNQQNAES
ncbi:hypothetical protein T10_13118 [Trichinella papuae]|uniref:Uncharacterized protein n=1 Tax=Trichinella papuae TaxID=268474 RepID=A0A0V1MTD2_9BILA|nr:hypothetical protein T10_13118 [Trichinella papuae]